MPTLPLLTPPTHPNASHRILAPGGYEGWHFDASSDDGRIHLVAALHEAWALDARYSRATARYLRRPTRRPPPVPQDHAAVTFAFFEPERAAVSFVARASASDVQVASNGQSVRVGGSHADRTADGSLQLRLRGAFASGTIAANLVFRPQLRADCTIDLGDERHGWFVGDALCDVNGEVNVFDPPEAAPRVVAFAGSGWHDHRWGTRPLADASPRWFGGRMLFDDRAVAFQQLREDASGAASVCDTRGGSGPLTEPRAIRVRSRAHTRWGIEYPTDVAIDGLAELRRAMLLHADRISATIAYEAVCGGESGSALCRVIHPRRLTWPMAR